MAGGNGAMLDEWQFRDIAYLLPAVVGAVMSSVLWAFAMRADRTRRATGRTVEGWRLVEPSKEDLLIALAGAFFLGLGSLGFLLTNWSGLFDAIAWSSFVASGLALFACGCLGHVRGMRWNDEQLEWRTFTGRLQRRPFTDIERYNDLSDHAGEIVWREGSRLRVRARHHGGVELMAFLRQRSGPAV